MFSRILVISDDVLFWRVSLGEGDITADLVRPNQTVTVFNASAGYDFVIVDLEDAQEARRLCANLRAAFGGVLLLFTTRQEESYLLGAYADGVDECMLKPLSPRLVQARLQAWRRRVALSASWNSFSPYFPK